MKLKKQTKLKKTVITGIFFISGWVVLHHGINIFKNFDAIPEPQTAAANMHYGIQGQQAPELNLETWIDGDGKRVDPIYLSDYRGKVIYLYFFQDW